MGEYSHVNERKTSEVGSRAGKMDGRRGKQQYGWWSKERRRQRRKKRKKRKWRRSCCLRHTEIRLKGQFHNELQKIHNIQGL